jgi:acyl-CoA synthetase (NDP forming)
MSVAEDALALGKPLVITKVGRTRAGARAIASHTGSLAGEDVVFDGVIRQRGIVRARSDEHLLDIVETAAKPFVVSWVGIPDHALAKLRDHGIAVMRGAEPAVDACAALVRYAEARRCWFADAVARSALALPRLDLPAAPGPVATLAAQALLDRCGVKTVASRLARSAEEAVSAAPVALKIESPDIPHKTEAQAVKLGLGDASAVRQAHTRSIEEQGASRRGARQTAGRSGRRDAGCRRGLVFRRRRRRTFEGTGPQSNSRGARRRRRRRLADRVDVNIPRQSRGLASPGWDPQRPLSEIASGSLWAEVGVC